MAFFRKLRGEAYDWDDLQRLVRFSERIKPVEIIATVERRFAVLQRLGQLELQVIDDARSGWNQPLADQLRAEIRDGFDS